MKKVEFVHGISFHNPSNDYLIVTKISDKGKCFLVTRKYEVNNKPAFYGRNFSREELSNGAVEKYCKKLMKDVYQYENVWENIFNESMIPQ